jgi:putative acetyltransferase
MIRIENPTSPPEHLLIRALNEAAFRGSEEADLVDKLRGGQALISLVAECGAGIVGHILFSRMWIKTPSKLVPAVALAPMAVLPVHQRKGIGQRLIVHGLELLKNQGERIVIVVGHPATIRALAFRVPRLWRLSRRSLAKHSWHWNSCKVHLRVFTGL